MSDPKKKTINVTDPTWCDVKMSDGRFILEVHSAKQCIRLHFERHWITYMAEIFWKVIRREAVCIEAIKRDLHGGE